MRASPALDGQSAPGRLTVFLGSIILAEVTLSIRVDSQHEAQPRAPILEPASARLYRKIFASYSHNDEAVVKEFERYVEVLGDRYLRDIRELRSGEVWSGRLAHMIDEADIF